MVETWRGKPWLTKIGYGGYRMKNGKRMSEDCVTFGAIKKLPRNKVLASDLIPSQIEGQLANGKHYCASTDVVESGFITLDSHVQTGQKFLSKGSLAQLLLILSADLIYSTK